MRPAPRRRNASLLAIVTTASLGALLGAFVACSNASEGDRCETLNGNADCQSGLVCTQVSSQASAACCPPDRRAATSPVCAQNAAPTTGDSAPPPDTGPADTTATGEPTEPDAASTVDGGADADADAAP